MKKSGDEIIRIEEWVEKLQSDMRIQAEALVDAFPEMTVAEAKEIFLLNKIATLTVALEDLAKNVRSIK